MLERWQGGMGAKVTPPPPGWGAKVTPPPNFSKCECSPTQVVRGRAGPGPRLARVKWFLDLDKKRQAGAGRQGCVLPFLPIPGPSPLAPPPLSPPPSCLSPSRVREGKEEVERGGGSREEGLGEGIYNLSSLSLGEFLVWCLDSRRRKALCEQGGVQIAEERLYVNRGVSR